MGGGPLAGAAGSGRVFDLQTGNAGVCMWALPPGTPPGHSLGVPMAGPLSVVPPGATPGSRLGVPTACRRGHHRDVLEFATGTKPEGGFPHSWPAIIFRKGRPTPNVVACLSGRLVTVIKPLSGAAAIKRGMGDGRI